MRVIGLSLMLVVVIGLSGCGKTLDQLRTDINGIIDAGRNTAKTVATHVNGVTDDVLNGSIDNGAGVAKKATDTVFAVYVDIKENFDVIKEMLGFGGAAPTK